MKTVFLRNILLALCITTNAIVAQTESKQFEKTQNEIINLINLPNPTFNPDIIQKPMTSEAIADLGFDQVYKNSPQKFTTRDGKQLFSYVYKTESNTTIILLHGILSSSYLMNKTAGLLKEATNSEVVALDFRGHGQSEGTPGDVDYINQYADDLEDVRARYFTGRAFDGDIEPPVYKVDNQSYISYGKALTVMLALRDLIGEKKVNKVIRTITDRNRNTNKLSVTTIELLDEIYKVTPTEYLILIDDWFKKVITYDIGIKNYSYKVLANGNYQVSIQVKANRYITMDSGETNKISINEPIKIGVFTKHPSKVKDDNSILYYNSSNIDKEFTEIKIIVNKKPSYVSIDPYGTRSDNNLVDNTRKLQK
ncbi:hypothetical protein DI383_00065 [Flavobacteriaceae bacterium LYZ1037]|nr:hypothetical protein DI383_00065 [Flavobacteriaceae bacterium LYZ1037]